MSNVARRLYNGDVSINFIGRRRTWYVLSAILVLIAVGSLAFRGLNLGIEFRGGSDFAVPNATCSVVEARSAADASTGAQTIVTEIGTGTIRVQTEPLTPNEVVRVANDLGAACGVPGTDIRTQVVGPSWGSEITRQALIALGVFLILLTIFLIIYFEWRMAVAAMVALVHDLIITVGIYSLFGLEVTPATLIGFLTILGYSLYDTVVVFDKVKENTRGITGQSVMTYAESANLAVNQTLVRSINTSITSLIPILVIIVVGAWLLGAGTLLDLAVALAVGTAVGSYSSIFLATPLLVDLKQSDPQIKALSARVHARRVNATKTERVDNDDSDGDDVDDDDAPPQLSTRVERGQRSQPKRTSRSKRKSR